MSLAAWITFLLFGIPLAMTCLVFWVSTRFTREEDNFDIPETWGSQDIDTRLKD